jgi:hypothetical protein
MPAESFPGHNLLHDKRKPKSTTNATGQESDLSIDRRMRAGVAISAYMARRNNLLSNSLPAGNSGIEG